MTPSDIAFNHLYLFNLLSKVKASTFYGAKSIDQRLYALVAKMNGEDAALLIEKIESIL